MEIRNLEYTDFEVLFHGFEKAFADYEIRFEKNEVRAMLKRRGYNPQLSFAAFDNGEIVAFTLNGTGTFNGVPTWRLVALWSASFCPPRRHHGRGLTKCFWETQGAHLIFFS